MEMFELSLKILGTMLSIAFSGLLLYITKEIEEVFFKVMFLICSLLILIGGIMFTWSFPIISLCTI